MNDYVRAGFDDGSITPDTPMSELNGIGSYLLKRIRTTLEFGDEEEITVKAFVRKFQNKTTQQVKKLLQLMLQNQRANQCTPRRRRDNADLPSYHIRDINQRGYDLCIALLRRALREPALRRGLRFQRLTSTPVRSNDASTCGCKTRATCTGSCKWKNRACIPRDSNATGFEGVDVEPDQKAPFASALQRQRLLNSARLRQSRSLQNDPDSRADVAAGHSLDLEYQEDGNNLWRIPSPRVRRPR
jgi:hypothetical protein